MPSDLLADARRHPCAGWLPVGGSGVSPHIGVPHIGGRKYGGGEASGGGRAIVTTATAKIQKTGGIPTPGTKKIRPFKVGKNFRKTAKIF